MKNYTIGLRDDEIELVLECLNYTGAMLDKENTECKWKIHQLASAFMRRRINRVIESIEAQAPQT